MWGDNYYASNTSNNKPGKICRTEKRTVKVLTRETARIMKTDEEKVKILIYEFQDIIGEML